MVKNDEEINSLGQLVVSLTKEILDTVRSLIWRNGSQNKRKEHLK